MNKLSKQICIMLKNSKFKQKGNAYFRIQGDGIIQVVKLEKERIDKACELKIGLYSMYSKLSPQWFTAKGCIPRYSIYSIADHVTNAQITNYIGGESLSCEESKIQKAIQWLDSINTQQTLVEGLCFLDTAYGGEIIWVDRLKIVPFLLSGNYDSAKLAVESILKQHYDAYSRKRGFYSPEDVENIFQQRKAEDEHLKYLLDLINTRNIEDIQKYAKTNYEKNKSYAQFCL